MLDIHDRILKAIVERDAERATRNWKSTTIFRSSSSIIKTTKAVTSIQSNQR